MGRIMKTQTRLQFNCTFNDIQAGASASAFAAALLPRIPSISAFPRQALETATNCLLWQMALGLWNEMYLYQRGRVSRIAARERPQNKRKRYDDIKAAGRK